MIHLARLPDWRARLDTLVRARLPQGFAWGVRDCCLWASDAVEALTGHDPAAEWRGTYSDAAGAAALLHRLRGLRGAAALGGVALPSVLAAHDGDVVLVRGGAKPVLGVVAGGVVLIQATTTLHALALDAALCTWGVGHA